MKSYFQAFLLMLQFMTSIPINVNLPCRIDNFKKGISFLPLVGAIIGLIQMATVVILKFVLPSNISIFIALIVGIAITGSIHLDGLGDTFDGFFAFKGKDRIIEIMKDSRIGTYSCIAIISDIMMKFFCFQALNEFKMLFVIAIIPVISRMMLTLLFFIGNTAKSTGTGNFFIGNCGKTQLFTSFLMGLAIIFPVFGAIKEIVLILSLIIFVVLFNIYCKRKIGGLTGDNLGAANELVEILSLIIIIAMR